jgi:hypothetical protein
MEHDFLTRSYRDQAEKLREEGYELQYDWKGYRVSFKGQFITAAGVLAEKPIHWRHKRANVRDNFMHCVREALRHRGKLDIDTKE